MIYCIFIFLISLLTIPAHALEKNLAIDASLHEIVPQYRDFHTTPGKGSWERYYETLNDAYLEILKYKDTHRKWTYETLGTLSAGHIFNPETEHTTILNYSPAFYARGVLAAQDGNIKDAHKHFRTAARLSHYRPQERNVHLHAFYACAAMESKLNNYGLACLLLVGQYADLQKSERVYWEPKIRAGLTRIVDKIETPWRKLLALLLVGNEKQQDKAIDEFKNAILSSKNETLKTHQVDLRDTILAIRALAENNLSAHAQAFIATIHLSQRNKKTCFFTFEPINPMQELSTALAMIREADVPNCKKAKEIHGEVAYAFARYLESHQLPQKESLKLDPRQLFEESAQCGYQLGIARYAHECLDNKEVPLSEEQAKKHLAELHRLSNSGMTVIQDFLAQAYFAGHAFGCGYTLPTDLKEAFVQANNNPASLEMLLIQGVTLLSGLEKTKQKKDKILWEIKPDIDKGTLQIEKAIAIDEESAYVHLHEFYIHPSLPQPMKDSIFAFVRNKNNAKKTSLAAVRALGSLLLQRGDTQEGIALLESIGTQYQNPHVYCELGYVYLLGKMVPQNLKKATTFAVKALRFFDNETIKRDDAIHTRNLLIELTAELHKEAKTENKEADMLLKILGNAMAQCGMHYSIKKESTPEISESSN